MNFLATRILCLLGVGLGGLALASRAQVRPNSAKTGLAKTKSAAIPEIEGYTRWRQVTEKPVEMEPRVSILCARPGPFRDSNSSDSTIQGTQGPHQKKWIRVYVNGAGEAAITTQKAPRFPVGSVIVKQKLSFIDRKNRVTGQTQRKIGVQPELLTVMIKRAPGYDTRGGNWEYLVSNGAGTRAQQRGKIASCQGCHRPYAQTDYIVRSYLPKEIEKALRDADAGLAPKP